MTRTIPGRVRAVTLSLITVLVFTLTTMGNPARATSQPNGNTASHANGSFAIAHGLAYTTTKAVVTDATGKVVSRKVSRGISDITGAGDCNNNPCRVEITQTGHSTLGFPLWHFTTWLKWYWKLQGPGLLHVINVDDKGVKGEAVDQFWDYSGVVDSRSEYYQACCGETHSGFWHYKKGQFNGPSLIHLGLTRHDRPENLILAQDNSWFWAKGS